MRRGSGGTANGNDRECTQARVQHLYHDELYAYRNNGRGYLIHVFHSVSMPIRNLQALDGKIEKRSPSLGREAIYTSHSRLTRLPSYLTVHMVRFAWRRDINKKAKIMVI